MDAHHSEGPGRTLHMLKILKHLPKLLKSNHKLSRGLFYDLALIYIDRELGIFFEKLKRQKLYQNSTFVLFGDHGWGKDLNRDKKMIGELGLRTYYEHINVPLIVSPLKNIKTTDNGLHDTMSVSATILDLLKIPKHNSFLGKSILNKGSQFIITESTSRGNCDIINKKIYFIITGDKFKLMVSYYNKKLQPLRLYDLENDSREMKNLINDKGFKGEVNLMIDYLKKKRKKLFDKI